MVMARTIFLNCHKLVVISTSIHLLVYMIFLIKMLPSTLHADLCASINEKI